MHIYLSEEEDLCPCARGRVLPLQSILKDVHTHDASFAFATHVEDPFDWRPFDTRAQKRPTIPPGADVGLDVQRWGCLLIEGEAECAPRLKG